MTRERPSHRIGIVGSYGGLNLGDEAILQAILIQLRESLKAEVTVFSRNAEDTRERHAVERAVPTRQLSRQELRAEIERLDLLIVGGGGILFDGEARNFLREAELAIESGVPTMIYAISAGPLREPTTQRHVRDLLNQISLITVRERGARQTLEEVGVRREIHVTADPALLLKPEHLSADQLKREGLDGEGPLIGMSVREPGAAAPDLSEELYHGLLANAADYMVDRFGARVVFVPMERGVLDMQHSHAVIARMLRPQYASVLKGRYSPGQLLSLIARFEFSVGMRLHFLILSALQGVPFVALPYASKVGGFIERMGLDMPPIHQVNAGRLLAHIDQSWDRRRSLQQKIERSLPGLQQKARQTHQLLLELLTAQPARGR